MQSSFCSSHLSPYSVKVLEKELVTNAFLLLFGAVCLCFWTRHLDWRKEWADALLLKNLTKNLNKRFKTVSSVEPN